jgi:hypothetical protein
LKQSGNSLAYPEKKEDDTTDDAKESILIATGGDVVEYIRPVIHNAQVQVRLGAFF